MAQNWFLAILTILFYANICSSFTYPTVRRSDKIEILRHGATYPDPYDWLEISNSSETKEFVDKQNECTFNYIKDNPLNETIGESFEKLYNYTRYTIPVKHGDWYYITINSGLQNQGVIKRMKNLNDEPEVFIDPNELWPNGTISLVFTTFSPNGKYVSFGTSKGGSDWITIGVFDASTPIPKQLNDYLRKIKFAYTGWLKNNQGFFYAYYDDYDGEGEGTESLTPLNQKIFYHKLGDDQSKDKMIFNYTEKPDLLMGTPIVSQNGKEIHLFPTTGTSSTQWLYIPFDQDNIVGPFEPKWIVPIANAEYFYVHQDDECTYVRTNYKAPNFRLVCVDLKNSSTDNWKTIIDSHPKYVLSDTLIVNYDEKTSKAKLIAVYMIDVVNMIQIYDLSNQQAKYLFDVNTPIGTIQSIGGKREGTEFFFRVGTFLSPGIVYRYDFSVNPNKVKIFKQSTVKGLDVSEFETRQIKYESTGGVMVPMFLVHRKNLVKNGQNPTMLYAYGGFNINIQPNYDALGMFFVKHLNGIYAVANIRGGGEYGDEWHKAGIKHNKQNVFDDFNHAGLWLIKNKYTDRDYITINGRSNGGLLVGACSNQFGKTFGAALANVGVMDMIRFSMFTIGSAWKEEYGDPQNIREDYHYIMKYSPLHTIPDSKDYPYPNMLVLTADHDDRVVPAHSYKFIAELQSKRGNLSETPLLIRIDHNSGHGAGKPLKKWIEENTDISLFLIKSMNGRYKFVP